MQTPKQPATKSTAFNEATNKPAEQNGNEFNEEEDFEDDFENDSLADLDYDGVSRFDDEDDDEF